MLDNLLDFGVNIIIFNYIFKQIRSDFIEHPPPLPVRQDTTYTKHVYQHSKYYVGVGSRLRGREDIAEVKKRRLGFLIKVVLYK